MKYTSYLCKAFLLVILAITACKKDDSVIQLPSNPPATLSAPEGFDFETTKTISLKVKLLAPNGDPLKNVLVHVFDNYDTQENRELYTGLTDKFGLINDQIVVPAYMQTIVIDPSYVGIMRQVKVGLQGGTASCTIGGANGYEGSVIPTQMSTGPEMKGRETVGSSLGYTYPGTYDEAGVPNYLEKKNDVIDAKLLASLNASLPESVPVTERHPEYLSATTETNLTIQEKSDVWITFLHEGASNLNSLAYYTYATGNAPKTAKDIKSLMMILPNASYSGSGGGLSSGNKIKIGQFEKGTTIGFALIANGWNYSAQKVGTGTSVFFSNDELNPETDANLKRHAVLLHDAERNLFLSGFEDLRRDGQCDNDFNDVVFYATSSPATAISIDNVNHIADPIDSDNDGVPDVNDAFPKDPTRAYIYYYPSQNTYGTIAFEDLWPGTGDYDMNDLVVNYRYKLIKNAANKVVEMNANYAVGAIGGSFSNGFGVQFPFAPSLIKKVTGGRLKGDVPLTFASNGVEAAQSKAVIIPFDNAHSLFQRAGYINTSFGSPLVPGDTLSMLISFNNPMDAATLGTFPFNPFLISNGRREVEVHLPGMSPTDLANTKLFNTASDNTIPKKNKYYKTHENMPFALNFAERFSNAVEKINIKDAYNKFGDWAKSGGLTATDWYSNTASDYRAAGKIVQ